MKKIVLTVPDMSCGHCVERIRRALEEKGIQCDIDLHNRTVTLDAKDEDEALRKLEAIDYPVNGRIEVEG
jgi:copper chaperone CopZ